MVSHGSTVQIAQLSDIFSDQIINSLESVGPFTRGVATSRLVMMWRGTVEHRRRWSSFWPTLGHKEKWAECFGDAGGL